MEAAALLPMNLVIAGIIWSVALGIAAGNYACSLVHRLPRSLSILEKKPYCGSCGAMLQVKDLFPVFSALLLRHRCRYCGVPYPTSHTWTEVLIGLLFALCFLQYNFSEAYLLVATIGVFLITLAAIDTNEGYLELRVLLVIVVSAMVWRTLQDHTIYGFFSGGFFGLMAGMFLWRGQVKRVNHIYSLPDGAKLFALAGLCLGAKGLVLFFGLFGFCLLIWTLWSKLRGAPRLTLTTPFAAAVMLPLLWPKLYLLLELGKLHHG
uniref:Bacterial peptidase A24 N-terminal domain protein n=1 Tax=uncultured bacterium CSL1 TaxID=1091565 RepID=G4WVA9_9BACT|nr:bacterial peptidase A24 N-terminal domain protein [uncultured bacterium CSL1]